MILIPLLLMQAAYAPETEAVMNRSRQQAEEQRIQQAKGRATKQAQAKETPRSGSAGLPLSPDIAAKLQACLDAAMEDPAAGVRAAQQWSMQGGSFSAAQCQGFAEARGEHWDAAIAAFETAATEAQKAGSDQDAARLWAQAGNAALAGGKAQQARGYFDAALAHGLPDGMEKGEIYLDRSRALVMAGEEKAARADLDQALQQAGADPLAWLLSATLARRSDDLDRARHDIAEAKKRAPDDASIALEEGNIAILSNDEAGAKAAWQRAVTLAPDSGQGAAAKDSLARLDGAAAEAGGALTPRP